ncbi:hypothetical protein ACFFJC_10840 [Novosphingobium soli]|uniref:Uncharacterized protein n=1 Tax=Novosphingobium soli TaxID=574956 RepID=A0ABV6CVM4_9SPHN
MGKTILVAGTLSFLAAVLVSLAARVEEALPGGPAQAHAIAAVER